jgi:ATP-dependent helicase/nuclease subunit B
VVDYKSSQKQLDPVLLEHGIQLQLLTYLNVLRAVKEKKKVFGVDGLMPAGVFYVSLRSKYPRKETRDEALKDTMEDREGAYQHTGRFDFAALPHLDARPGATSGTQFNYRLKKDGMPYSNASEVMDSGAFKALLDGVETNLKRMGTEVFSGTAAVSPYRKGKVTACLYCDYH